LILITKPLHNLPYLMILMLFWQYGANPDQVDKEGHNAAHYASAANLPNCVRLLQPQRHSKASTLPSHWWLMLQKRWLRRNCSIVQRPSLIAIMTQFNVQKSHSINGDQ